LDVASAVVEVDSRLNVSSKLNVKILGYYLATSPVTLDDCESSEPSLSRILGSTLLFVITLISGVTLISHRPASGRVEPWYTSCHKFNRWDNVSVQTLREYERPGDLTSTREASDV
jgi:hypothetical protein